MKLIVLYGPPAVGKLTVGQELSRTTGFKLFDNHLSNDAVQPVFDYGHPSMERLVDLMRLAVLRESARQGVDVIFTVVYAHNTPRDLAAVARIFRAVERYGGEVCLVQLHCSDEVNRERLRSPSRLESKINSLELLNQVTEGLDLVSPIPDRESLRIDNTELEPEIVAQQISQHYGLL